MRGPAPMTSHGSPSVGSRNAKNSPHHTGPFSGSCVPVEQRGGVEPRVPGFPQFGQSAPLFTACASHDSRASCLRSSAKSLVTAIFPSGFAANLQLIYGRNLYAENPTGKADVVRQ